MRAHCKIPEPEVYEFRPVGFFWRTEIRKASPSELVTYRRSLLHEIKFHRSEMLRLGIACGLAAPNRDFKTTADECMKLVALLEAHKALIFEAEMMPPMSEAPHSYIEAHPFAAKNVPGVS
ncbi:hypothetical protein CMV30_18985 [Nibricoccus aquaticus]|uniref:Uncharacterized protein n=1 Tax=Nibricoccus aquaticus TaxID=2576891 RepID=A0A290QBN9_9BACT|nr:hypothetical protein [Nibricoccus aquaticus]ATC65863.1 hypothetical protein CMV30_18985 [Nibricoccus aquaticus]